MNGNYPPGAENDPLAPYNKEDKEAKLFDIFCSQTLSKEYKISTSEYEEDDDISNVDLYSCFEQDHYTPLELIHLFKEYLEVNIQYVEPSDERDVLQRLIEECSNWSEDETEILEN